MKTNRSSMKVRCLIFTSLAVCFSAAVLSAREWQASFSLPFEARWGNITLPAGDYSVHFNTNDAGSGFVLLGQGTRKIGFVGVLNAETPSTPAKSQLLIVREGSMATVHILYIAELGTAFHFKVPERFEVYTRLIARAGEPAVIQRIPVTVSGVIVSGK